MGRVLAVVNAYAGHRDALGQVRRPPRRPDQRSYCLTVFYQMANERLADLEDKGRRLVQSYASSLDEFHGTLVVADEGGSWTIQPGAGEPEAWDPCPPPRAGRSP